MKFRSFVVLSTLNYHPLERGQRCLCKPTCHIRRPLAHPLTLTGEFHSATTSTRFHYRCWWADWAIRCTWRWPTDVYWIDYILSILVGIWFPLFLSRCNLTMLGHISVLSPAPTSLTPIGAVTRLFAGASLWPCLDMSS